MFLHNLKYEFLQTLRQKEIIGWMMIFPIVLSTLFNLAFGNLYEKDIAFSEIPVAVVEIQSDSTFKTVMDELSSGDNALFDTQYTDEATAKKLLKNGDINSIIYVDSELSMAVSANGLMPSITRSFLEQYETQKAVITETIKNNPEKLQDVINVLSAEINCVDTIPLTNGNMNPYASYFQNLIAMVALFGTTSGLFAATSNQGNLSAIGARKCVSPAHKLKSTIASFLSAFFVQTLCTFLCITYIQFILNIDMGDKIAMLYISGAIGSFTGTSLGFLIGSIGKISEGAKVGICMSVIMGCCFLSGLMVGEMKAIIAEHCPIINKINPAALISDLFYCLTIYNDYSRYTQIIISLISMSFIFLAGGFLLTRRKKYASI